MKLVPSLVAILVAAPLLAGTPALAAPAHSTTTATVHTIATAKTYKNCTALNRIYKHGVGKKGARDHTSGKPVKNFTVNNAVYAANKKSDRDKDGIACEKR